MPGPVIPRKRVVAFFGERDRRQGRFLVEHAIEALNESGLAQSVLVRGSEGFGARHRRQNAGLLSLSEDLPLMVTGAGDADEATGAAATLRGYSDDSLVLLEGGAEPTEDCFCRIEVWLRRGRKVGRTSAWRLAVDAARTTGAEAAVALLGVDGTNRGNRERARFFSGNAGVPVVVSALMPGASVARFASRLGGEIPGAAIDVIPASTSTGGADNFERLTVYGADALTDAGEPLHSELLRIVRREGGAGGTTVTGVYGYSGDSELRGDLLLQLRRRVPVLIEVVDSAENCARWEQVALVLGDTHVRTTRTPVLIQGQDEAF